MKKLNKILSLFTAIFISISLFLVGPAGLTLNQTEIRAEIENLNIEYQNVGRNALKDHPGWLNLFTDVLTYAQATETDVKISPRPEDRKDNWADYITRDGGFTAISGEGDVVERSNIQAMLANFNHNERFFQSNWRVKDDYHLLQDWGALYYTVEHKNGQVKPYRAIIYDSNDGDQAYGKFGNKIREIYNLDPTLNANFHDMLCLRAVFRTIKALDGDVDDNLSEMLDRFFTSGAYQKLIKLLANDAKVKNILGLHEDFSLGNMQNPRTNPIESNKAISKFIIGSYYGWDKAYKNNFMPDDTMEAKNGTKYQIVFDPQSGYVSDIIKTRSGSSPGTLEITEKNQNSAPTTAVFVTMSPDPNKNLAENSAPPKNSTILSPDDDENYIVRNTGFGASHIALLLVCLGILIILAQGLGYIVISRSKKNAK